MNHTYIATDYQSVEVCIKCEIIKCGIYLCNYTDTNKSTYYYKYFHKNEKLTHELTCEEMIIKSIIE